MKITSSFVLILALVSGAFAQTSSMTTVAAQLNGPYGIAVDSAGNLYIAEWYNHRILKVTPSGVITTVAGSGNSGYNGDGIPATSADLKNPEDVAVDAAGNLYIADSFNNRVRKVSADTGLISTIAGTGQVGYNGEGPALSATLNDPGGVAVDANGNVYIADQSSHRIRMVSGGMISTVVGTGVGGFSGDGGPATAAQIYNPVHLTFDKAGALYIADSLNNRIRKVDLSSGVITTVAGKGTDGFSGDGGRALDAELNIPAGVAVNSAGDIYIADSKNGRIRKVSAKSGFISTVAGGSDCSQEATLGLPLGVALDASRSELFINDFPGNVVRVIGVVASSGPPTLTALTPSSSVPSRTRAVTLTGSGFIVPAAEAGCTGGVTSVVISGSGLTLSNVNVASDSSLTFDLAVASNAQLGAHPVKVTNQRGQSNTLDFIVNPPRPELDSITPSSGARGSTVSVTLSGFDLSSASGSTVVNVSGTAVTVSNVIVRTTNQLTATFNVSASAALGTYGVSVTTVGGSSNSVPFIVNPRGPTISYAMPQTLNPSDQVPVRLTMANTSPDAVTGQLTMTFVPNASTNADDASVTFINAQANMRTVDFTFPANSSEAQFSLSNGMLRTGTVAGTIRLALSGVKDGGQEVSPPNNTYDITIPRLAPVITNVRFLNRTAAGFDVEITGYSDSKDIQSATFKLGPAPGALLDTGELKPEVKPTFITYYQSDASVAAGSAFVYVQPFVAVQGDANAVGSVTVTLTNSQGTSAPKSAN